MLKNDPNGWAGRIFREAGWFQGTSMDFRRTDLHSDLCPLSLSKFRDLQGGAPKLNRMTGPGTEEDTCPGLVPVFPAV